MSSPGFLLIIVAFGFLYIVLIRPQKKRQLAAKSMMANLGIGDEVVTAGGIYGHVAELLDDDVMLEIAPQLRVKVARKAIGAIIPPVVEGEVVEEDDEPADEHEEHGKDDPPAAENGGGGIS
jgi:preprotein translocase subunit YajC